MSDHDDMKALAHDLPVSFLECRDFGHSWRAHRMDVVGQAFEETLKCSRCEAEKTRVMGRRFGDLEGNAKTKYPPGYVVPNSGRNTSTKRSAFRHARLEETYNIGSKKPRQRKLKAV